MKRTLHMLLIFFCAFTCFHSAAQIGSFSTSIIDENNEPIMYANVGVFQDEQFITGTVSDENGKVTLSGLPMGEYDLKFSSIGYETLEQTISITNNDQDVKRAKVIMMRAVYELIACEIVEVVEPEWSIDGASCGIYATNCFPEIAPSLECEVDSIASSGPVVGGDDPEILQQVTVYPNPTRGLVTINSEAAIYRLEMFDMNGTLIWNKSYSTPPQQIDFSQHPVGTYLLRLNGGQLGGALSLVKMD